MVLVDSSVWIEYFKGNNAVMELNKLIDSNNLCINELILAELIPSIVQKKEEKLKELLLAITKIKIDINWNQIVLMQIRNINSGINKVGIADLIIAQNAVDNKLELFTLDKHFLLMSEIHGIKMYQ